jgi:hypothetical protein
MTDFDALTRAWSRVQGLTGFDPGERIWWIYLRNAALDLTARHSLPALEETCAPLKDMPERVMNEGQHWLALREAVTLLLEQDASE